MIQLLFYNVLLNSKNWEKIPSTQKYYSKLPRQKNPFTRGPSVSAMITVIPVFSDTYLLTGITSEAFVEDNNLKWDILIGSVTRPYSTNILLTIIKQQWGKLFLQYSRPPAWFWQENDKWQLKFDKLYSGP